MDKILEIFAKMDHHQDLADMAAKLGDERQVCVQRTWVGICDLELQTLFFGKAKVSTGRTRDYGE